MKDYVAGKIDFRNDNGGNIHAVVGKLSFDQQKLEENVSFFLDTIKRMKPTAAKGHFIKKVCLSATMSPSVEVALSA